MTTDGSRKRLSATLRSPAVHFALVGGLLFAGSRIFGPAAAPVETTRLEVSAERIDAIRLEMAFELGRSPSAEELRLALDQWIDEEILVRHALELGLDREPAVEQRLALIGGFVAGEASDEPGGDRASNVGVLAQQARELGLHRSDRVVRNILVDRASRLIREAVLSRRPTDEALDAYLHDHADDFSTEPTHALLHVEVRGERQRAERLLGELRAADPDAAEVTSGVWGDAPSVDASQPALPEPEISRRLGYRFAGTLPGLPVGGWSGPVESRYGWHLVKITERNPGALPPLDSIRDRVEARMLRELAGRWLDERMRMLRASYDITIAGEESGRPLAEPAEAAS